MAEVQGEHLRAEQASKDAEPSDKLTRADVRKLVLQLRDIASVLSTADPKLKAEVYAVLGVNITYDHAKRLVVAEATGVQQSVSERGLEPLRPCGH